MRQVISQFRLEGAPVRCERYGNGHINETYLLETDAPHAYILQKVNRHVFPDIPGLMQVFKEKYESTVQEIRAFAAEQE